MVVKRTPRKPKARSAPHPIRRARARTIWEELAEIGRQIPDSEWDKVPRDLAKNFDHYAHGSPRED